jgi:hypothetical protein
MEIKVNKIEDPNTRVPINNEEHKIEHIKAEFAKCKTNPQVCEVEVFNMWSDLPDD